MKTDQELTGIGGWLLLLGLGLVGSVVKNVYELYSVYYPLIISEKWGQITDPESKYYNPLLSKFIYIEMFSISLLLVVGIYVTYLFFMRKKYFPRMFVVLILLSFAMTVVSVISFSVIVPTGKVFDQQTLASVVGSVFNFIVWVPYLRWSRRVRLTFVN